MAIDPTFIELLKAKNDIVEVVSKYTPLEQKGENYWARCPLPGHSERTPSFCVNSYGQFFKCFGCGRGGNVINFIMETETLSFFEAVKFLSDRAGLELPDNVKEEKKNDEQYKKKSTLLSILKDTALFYVANLRSGKATEHEKYIKKRGLSPSTITKFGIGASLDYDGLPGYLKSKGYRYEDMIAAGVVTEKEFNGEKRYSDFEAKRLIFPIINAMGEVIAFGGRVLEKTDFGKYKNTKETFLFVKNKTLYNINRIKKMRSKGAIPSVIMVEGYMDAISLSEAGFENVVASMGTSLTKEQARLLKRYTENVYISYDGDFAGQSANVRGLEILKNEGLNVKVITLPDGLDPDDLIKKSGAEAYQKLIEEALPLIDYKLKILYDKYMDKTDEGKRKYVSEAIKVIETVPLESEREDLVKKVSAQTKITFQSIMRDIEKSSETQVIEQKQEKIPKSETALEQAERFILARVLISEKFPLPGDFILGSIPFTDKYRMEISIHLQQLMSAKIPIKPSFIVDFMEDEEGKEEARNILMQLDLKNLMKDDEDRFLKDSVRFIKRDRIEKKITELVSMAEKETDIEKRNEIMRMIIDEKNRLKRTNLM
ncbi:MAG: DNA primase [Candidatus Borkfalkiaceae bacterium]|nr:DNA primase [Christensenellaceae bacterium]